MIKTKIKNNQKKNIIIEIERVITFYFFVWAEHGMDGRESYRGVMIGQIENKMKGEELELWSRKIIKRSRRKVE